MPRLCGRSRHRPRGSRRRLPRRPLLGSRSPRCRRRWRRASCSPMAFRESWETHREGMLGAPEVSSSFPPASSWRSLPHGATTSVGRIDEFLTFTSANRFRYYDHPWSDADADTIGVFLRLFPHATQASDHAGAVRQALLPGAAGARGRGDPGLDHGLRLAAGRGRGRAAADPDAGESCGTVMAHALLGLLASASQLIGETIEIGSKHLLGRIRESGFGRERQLPAPLRPGRSTVCSTRSTRTPVTSTTARLPRRPRPGSNSTHCWSR